VVMVVVGAMVCPWRAQARLVAELVHDVAAVAPVEDVEDLILVDAAARVLVAHLEKE